MIKYELIYEWRRGTQVDGFPIMANKVIVSSLDRNEIESIVQKYNIKFRDPSLWYASGFYIEEIEINTDLYKNESFLEHIKQGHRLNYLRGYGDIWYDEDSNEVGKLGE